MQVAGPAACNPTNTPGTQEVYGRAQKACVLQNFKVAKPFSDAKEPIWNPYDCPRDASVFVLDLELSSLISVPRS